jgi:hypothetical protein
MARRWSARQSDIHIPRQTIFELESGVRANGLCAAPIIKGNAVDKIPPREIEVGDEAPHNVSAAVDYCVSKKRHKNVMRKKERKKCKCCIIRTCRFHNITGHGGIIHLKGCHGKES